MEHFEPLLYLLLGWLFGLLGPGIVERIRRRYRIADVTKAIVTELQELRFSLSLSAYLLGLREASLTDDNLDWIVRAVSDYSGPQLSDPKMVEGITKIRSLPEAERIAVLRMKAEQNRGLTVKELSLALLSAHLSEISLFPVSFQSIVLRIKNQLDIYNQQVRYVQEQFNLTFTVTDQENHAALRANQSTAFRGMLNTAKIIAGLIEQLH